MLMLCCFSCTMVVTFVTVLVGTMAMLFTKAKALGGNSKKVLLKNVKTLTLRKDAKTSHRRVSAIPQLKCVDGSGCRYHQVDVMRCENAGSDYDDDSIQWTCRANVPEEFKLGSTDVRCEGYSNPRDPFILKGSCGVEYRLLLTEKGMEKYGGGSSSFSYSGPGVTSKLFAWVFWAAFFGVVFIMARSAWRNMRDNNRRPPRRNNGPRPPFPPFDDHGGGPPGPPWFPGDNGDPPPPYTPFSKAQSSSAGGAGAQQQAWTPGFWTGALGGAAATYLARGRNNRRNDRTTINNPGNPTESRYNTRNRPTDNGEGSSSASSNWHSSTGFGSTSNR